MLPRQKRIGAILMAVAILLSLITLSVAGCDGCTSETSLFVWLWFGLKIDLGRLLQDVGIYEQYSLPVKYPIIAFLTVFFVGLLSYIGAIGWFANKDVSSTPAVRSEA